MTVDNLPNSGDGLFYSCACAEHAAAELRAQGRQTRIEESLFYPGQWVVHATPAPPEVPEDKRLPAAIVEVDLSNSPALLLHTYRSKTEAERAAIKFQMEGRRTKVRPSVLHKNRWVVFTTKLEGE